MTDGLIDERKIGFFLTENAIVDDEELDVYTKMVYITLLRYASGQGTCFPSVATIAKKVPCSENRVRKALKMLEEKKIIQIEARRTEDRCLSNLYHIKGIKFVHIKKDKPKKEKIDKTEKKQDKGKNKNKFRNFNETFTQYKPNELEMLIKESQQQKFE